MDRLAGLRNPTRHFRSIKRRQTGILVDEYPGLRESLKLRNSTFLVSARIEKLSHAHI